MYALNGRSLFIAKIYQFGFLSYCHKKMKTRIQYKPVLSSTEAKWFAIYVRYRSEKMVADHLSQKGITSYLPLNRILRQYGRSKKWVELPLISNYVFVNITKADYVRVLQTNHVLQFVKIAKELVAIPQREIDLLKQVTGEEEFNLEVVPFDHFSKGDKVEITSGRLVGLQGKLIGIKGKKSFVVELEHIGYALKIEVPSNVLARIN